MNNKLIKFIIIISIALMGCNKSELDINREEIGNAESRHEAIESSTLDIIKEVESLAVYQFHDASVKAEVERYFNRMADQLTTIDLEDLSEFKYLVITEPIETLKDLPFLFPNLRYLNLTYSDSMSETDITILEDMELLRALTLTAKRFADLDFAKRLPYLELSYADQENLTGQDSLASFSVLGKDFINSNIDGSPLKLIKVSDELGTYEMVFTNKEHQADLSSTQERKIFVSQLDGDNFFCTNILDATDIIGNFASNRLHIRDVNFDGKDDILIDNGHFGNQGLVTYTCFLNIDGEYSKNESFTNIANPAIDVKNEKILSAWRNSAASHSWAMYVYDGTNYVMMDCLTEEALISSMEGTELNQETWQYTIEKCVNNEMEIINIFTTQDYTEERISVLIYDENSYWNLLSDKWKTLFNHGKMTDFSIYDSSYIDDAILDIINRE